MLKQVIWATDLIGKVVMDKGSDWFCSQALGYQEQDLAMPCHSMYMCAFTVY